MRIEMVAVRAAFGHDGSRKVVKIEAIWGREPGGIAGNWGLGDGFGFGRARDRVVRSGRIVRCFILFLVFRFFLYKKEKEKEKEEEEEICGC
jgi:hypothetical protein